MKTIETKNIKRRGLRSTFLFTLLMLFWVLPQPASAHCDSYDGPVIQDALKAFEKNNVEFVLKWVEAEHEAEIKNLFAKTAALKEEDQEVYQIVEQYFLETLVRLHREGEGAPYTGLKPAGSTAPIIAMADHALEVNGVDELLGKLNNHIRQVIREKYEKAADLKKVKDESVEKGRAYVAAYVDYTHTLEGIEAAMLNGAHGHAGH